MVFIWFLACSLQMYRTGSGCMGSPGSRCIPNPCEASCSYPFATRTNSSWSNTLSFGSLVLLIWLEELYSHRSLRVVHKGFRQWTSYTEIIPSLMIGELSSEKMNVLHRLIMSKFWCDTYAIFYTNIDIKEFTAKTKAN